MKPKSIILAALIFATLSTASYAVSDQDKAKLMSVMKDASPYAVGMGKSVDDVCQGMANDMVNKYGGKLSARGNPPSEIRTSAAGICLDAASSAFSSQSVDEVVMWRNSALKNLSKTLHGESEGSPARAFLTDTIDHSMKMAKVIALMQEISRSQAN